MTIIQAAKYLEQIALSSPYIRTTKEGSVYDIMNTNGKIKYGVFVLSQTQHRQDDLFDYIGFNAFVIDRLDDDLESNRLQIQSTAKEVLANIVLTFKNRFYGSTFEQLVFHPFTEKFTDLCAGQYCQLNIKVPRTLICEDSYGELTHNYELVPLVVTITENGVKEYKPETFDAEGFENVTIRVNVDNSGSYSSGYTSGYTDGYISGTTDGYSSGKTDGIEEQKAKLISTSITENGLYEREDGFSSIEVNVDTGTTINNQTKSISITENGTSAITYDNGFTGLETVNIEVNVSGYTQEDLDNAYQSGVTEQKAKLISTSITENGLYEREDGFNSIDVNIPQTGYTQEDLDNAYQSGVTSGVTQQKSKLVATAFTENGNYTKADGYSAVTVNVPTQNYWNSGFTSGYTVGYSSGKTDGVAEQKAKLTSTAITENGTYTRTDGYSAVTVNVSGYTQEDLENAYNRGYDNGVNYCENIGSYLTFDVLTNGEIRWTKLSGSDPVKTIYYSKNNGSSWNSITSTEEGAVISVNTGDKVLFKGDNTSYAHNSFYGTTCQFNVYGNIMSLISSTNFASLTTFTTNDTFFNLFYYTDVISAENLILPATTLTEGCYKSLFKECIYLTTAPVLPASVLVRDCYESIFYKCRQLNYIKCMATDMSADGCLRLWVYMLPATGTFVKKTGSVWGSDNIPSGWLIINVNR